jgi:hypothetical protein
VLAAEVGAPNVFLPAAVEHRLHSRCLRPAALLFLMTNANFYSTILCKLASVTTFSASDLEISLELR